METVTGNGMIVEGPVFRCKRNKGIYYQKFRCNQEGGG